MNDVLSDSTLLNAMEQLMKENKLPCDLLLGRLVLVLHPDRPLRDQLSAAILPIYPTLVAEKFTKNP